MNRLDWAQIALSLVIMLTELYIALFRRSRRRVLATTREASVGVALLGLSYLVGGFEGSAVEGPLLDRVEAYSALVGVLVMLGALIWQARLPNNETRRPRALQSPPAPLCALKNAGGRLPGRAELSGTCDSRNPQPLVLRLCTMMTKTALGYSPIARGSFSLDRSTFKT